MASRSHAGATLLSHDSSGERPRRRARGFASRRERTKVLALLDACHWLDPPENLWQEAGDLGYALRRKGVTVKTFNLLIATFALSHGTELLTLDSDFGLMRSKGVPLQLMELDA